jgi:hypothetical protein
MTPDALDKVRGQAEADFGADDKQLAIFNMLQALLTHERDKEAYGRVNGSLLGRQQ